MLIQEYGIQHHISFAYKPQTNKAVEAANKNIKMILRKMVEIGQKSSLSHCGLIVHLFVPLLELPHIKVYGMEAVLPVEIEMRSLRVALE